MFVGYLIIRVWFRPWECGVSRNDVEVGHGLPNPMLYLSRSALKTSVSSYILKVDLGDREFKRASGL